VYLPIWIYLNWRHFFICQKGPPPLVQRDAPTGKCTIYDKDIGVMKSFYNMGFPISPLSFYSSTGAIPLQIHLQYSPSQKTLLSSDKIPPPSSVDYQSSSNPFKVVTSLKRVLRTGIVDTTVCHYDIQKPNGEFEVRYWINIIRSPINSPVMSSPFLIQKRK